MVQYHCFPAASDWIRAIHLVVYRRRRADGRIVRNQPGNEISEKKAKEAAKILDDIQARLAELVE